MIMGRQKLKKMVFKDVRDTMLLTSIDNRKVDGLCFVAILGYPLTQVVITLYSGSELKRNENTIEY